MLKIQLNGKSHGTIWVVEKLYSIGSATDNNLVINDPSVSPIHAKIITKDNHFYIKDNNSENGCFVNQQRITQKEIFPGDTIRLGNVEISVLLPQENELEAPAKAAENEEAYWTLVADSSWLSGREFKILRKCTTIGRGNDCDITIPGTHLSRRHAEITVQGKWLHIRDLGSANGTYIDDERVTEGIVRPGQRLRLDVYSFRVIGPSYEKNKTQLRRQQPIRPTPNLATTKLATAKTDNQTKQWKIRSTSPGNRIEPIPKRNSALITWFSIGLCVLMLAALAYIFTLH